MNEIKWGNKRKLHAVWVNKSAINNNAFLAVFNNHQILKLDQIRISNYAVLLPNDLDGETKAQLFC